MNWFEFPVKRVLASCLAIIVVVCTPALPTTSSDGNGTYVSHGKIIIEGDDDFTAENGVVGGIGTPANPYVISGWDISTSDRHAFAVTNTSASFVMRDCNVHAIADDTIWFGIDLLNVSNCLIQRVSSYDCVVGMALQDVSDVRIESCVLSDNMDGIYVSGAEGPVRISDCKFYRCHQGIDLDYATGGVEVIDNDMTADIAVDHGGPIHLSHCSGGLVAGNRLSRPPGIVVIYSTGIAIKDNTLENCALFLSGDEPQHYFTNDIAKSNTVNGRPVLFVKNKTGASIDCSRYGEVLGAGLSGVVLDGFTGSSGMEANGWAIAVAYSYDVTVSGGKFHDSAVLYATRVSDLTITGSTFSDGGGIWLDRVNGCSVYHNNFFGAVGESIWINDCTGVMAFDGGYPNGGNYWEDSIRVDNNSDGISDNPVNLGDAPEGLATYADRYPLMEPYGKSSSSDLIIMLLLGSAVLLMCLRLLLSNDRRGQKRR